LPRFISLTTQFEKNVIRSYTTDPNHNPFDDWSKKYFDDLHKLIVDGYSPQQQPVLESLANNYEESATVIWASLPS
jgi:hypothetical protein